MMDSESFLRSPLRRISSSFTDLFVLLRNMTNVPAEWDVETTKIFIDLCIEQIYKKERLGTSFTRDGWKYIVSKFNTQTEKEYTKKQLKNKLDSLKSQWTAWERLFSKETGIAIDYSRNMVIAEDEWWERKIKENKAYGKYRYKEEGSGDGEEELEGANLGGSVQVPSI
ncbi:hypothetical protein K1719_000959 [Acacia pycnantha]|nr:hypothetical protein K1719_000959 [Acacia pycnantha]